MSIGPASALARAWPYRWVDAAVRADRSVHHYRRRTDRPDRPWQRQAQISDQAVGPAALTRRGRTLFATVPEPDGPRTYRLEGSTWLPASLVVEAQHRAAQSPAGAEDARRRGRAGFRVRGRDHVLVDEDGSVFDWHALPDGTWEREACLRLADATPFGAGAGESVKLAQLSGDRDATPTPSGIRRPTLSSSLATAGVRGTDLGVRVEHAGRSFLLFGDTHWTRPWLATRDAIAEVLPGTDLPQVRFHGSPLKLSGRAAGRVTMREYDVPLDGFSHSGHLYALFSSNHFRHGRVMGRSVLARSATDELRIDPAARRRPVRFDVLGTFSEQHFINASVQLRPARAVPGCGEEGEVLLVWGSGPYRASEPRLALLDQAALARLERGAPPARAGIRYWAGEEWSDHEADAAPLFSPAALGELSVRWVAAAGRYLMLYASAPEDPIGAAVVLRSAAEPWGPWSRRVRLLDWVASGMSSDPYVRFIAAARDGDPVGERIFRAQADATGAAYAPYLFDATSAGADLVLRYTLSTWNPYQVVLMQHRLPLDRVRNRPQHDPDRIGDGSELGPAEGTHPSTL